MVDIAGALGIGSGINTTQLVNDLVSAAKMPRQNVIATQMSNANAKISALASAKNALATFSTALSSALQGTGYAGQPVSNDPSIASVSLIAGGLPQGLPAQLEVKQIAQAQTLVSAAFSGSDAQVGLGTLTLHTASGEHEIEITSSNNSLSGLAAAINGRNAGVTASVVTDQSGARLVLKGATGAANQFSLSAGSVDGSRPADADLQRFVHDDETQSLVRSQGAHDAIVEIDGIEMRFAENVLKTAIPFVRIDLNRAAPGTMVTLATDEPTTSVKQLVQEFVTAYNSLRSALNNATAPGTEKGGAGALAGDPGVRDMMARLSRLTSTTLNADNGDYKTLANIGVRTEKDGTLTLDVARLDKVLAENPAAVTQLLNPAVSNAQSPGIAGALKTITDAVTGTEGSLVVSQTRYESLQKALTKQQESLDTQMSAYQQSLTATYSQMQTRLTALKATQSYLEQQIAVWSGKAG